MSTNNLSTIVKQLFCIIFLAININEMMCGLNGTTVSTIIGRDRDVGVVGVSDDNRTCLMDSICKNNDKSGSNRNSPCHQIHVPYDNVTDDDFYDLLWTHCPHFFDDKGDLLHPICCSAEQEDSISRLISQVDIIRRSCPSCTTNAKKYFCNLFCLPKQSEILNIEKTIHKAILNISYVISKQFAETFYQSCRDVRIFGAYLMDQEFICGPYKRSNCTAERFLTTLGSISQMPLIIHPVITDLVGTGSSGEGDGGGLVSLLGHRFRPMSGQAYQCYESPPNDNACSCDNCERRCNETLLANYQNNNNNHQNVKLNDENAATHGLGGNLDQFFIYRIVATVLVIKYIF
ncbi:NPC1-like intracellular cholesterol transporter 1 [Oppia nitens]|uniref:NPC1-like intracellular cholesterol transporter 1 n=1 Tax=Oppia nitens TaxID=1686743 RepID=UPI0023DB29D8|nr:NPC1-like intracellular cholesterol transporter 1 [Oppia nitens]